MVLGMHRSGTSALAGTFGLLGATLPTDLLGPHPSNPKGHFESTALLTIHDEMLAGLQTAWYDFRHIDPASLNSVITHKFKAKLIKALRRRYNDASLFVVKDPRICRFFPLARSAIEGFGASLRVVFCVRHPLEVANSLRTRNGISLSHGLGLWLRHMLDAELHSRGLPRVFIDYSDFLRDWRMTIGRIERRLRIAFPGRSTDTVDAIDKFVDAGLRHHTASIHELEGRWVGPCYEAFAELVRNPDDKEAMHRLDLIRTAFEEPASFFGGGINEYYTELLDLRRVTEQLAHAEQGAKSELDALRSEHARVSEQLAHAEQAKTTLMTQLAEAEQAKTTLMTQVAEAEQQLQAIQRSRSWRVTGPIRDAITLWRRLVPWRH
jgi:hypothetical protein